VTVSTYIDDCLRRKVIFFTGKGGVGKTSLTWATALACHARGARVAVTSWSPFESDPEPAPEAQGITRIRLETLSAFREYVLNILKFEAVYNAVFDNQVLRAFIQAAPGLPETVVGGKIWDMYDKREQDLILVDLPSSGHAVTFFSSPLGVSKLFSVGIIHRETEKILKMFRGEDTRIDLVALPEELPLVECIQLKAQLENLLPFHFGFLHLNQCLPRFPVPHGCEGGLPPEATGPYHRYLERVSREEAMEKYVGELRLPTLRLPRLAAQSAEETLRGLTAELEQQREHGGRG